MIAATVYFMLFPAPVQKEDAADWGWLTKNKVGLHILETAVSPRDLLWTILCKRKGYI